MDTIFGLLISIVIWTVICIIVGNFGRNRTIGFIKTFLSSFFLSPLIAMLFVLASEKTDKKDYTNLDYLIASSPLIVIVIFLLVLIFKTV